MLLYLKIILIKIKEQLLQEIQSSYDSLLVQTLDFLRFLKIKEKENIKTDEEKIISSTGKNLVEHIKGIGEWSGDDFEECWKTVTETRTSAKFNTSNPFDLESS